MAGRGQDDLPSSKTASANGICNVLPSSQWVRTTAHLSALLTRGLGVEKFTGGSAGFR